MFNNDYTDYNPEVLRGTAFQIPPWIIVKTNGSAILEMKGPLVFLLQYLASSMKFRYEIIDNPEYKFAHGKLVNNTWVGLLGLLYRNAVDFTLVPAGTNPERCSVSRMPLPFAYTDMTILSGRSSSFDLQGVSTFHNMSSEFWICYAACFLFSSIVSWVSEVSANGSFNRSLADTRKNKFLRFCWEILSCVFSKEIGIPTRKIATRIILAAWLLGGFIITIIIGGDLTATMAIVPPEFTIDDLKDITLKPNLRADIMAFSSHASYVESNNPILAARIHRDGSGAPMPILMKEGKFRDIVGRKAVQINDRYTLLSAVKKYCEGPTQIRGFYFAKNLITRVPVSMFFNKRLSKKFMDQINIRMLRISQHGIDLDWMRPASKITPDCFFQPQNGEYAPLVFGHVYPAFKLWLKGLAVATSFFLMELCLHYVAVLYRDTRRGGNRPKTILDNFKSKLTRTCCRETVPKMMGNNKFVTQRHRKRNRAPTNMTRFRQVSPSMYEKTIGPADFRRILWPSREIV